MVSSLQSVSEKIGLSQQPAETIKAIAPLGKVGLLAIFILLEEGVYRGCRRFINNSHESLGPISPNMQRRFIAIGISYGLTLRIAKAVGLILEISSTAKYALIICLIALPLLSCRKKTPPPKTTHTTTSPATTTSTPIPENPFGKLSVALRGPIEDFNALHTSDQVQFTYEPNTIESHLKNQEIPTIVYNVSIPALKVILEQRVAQEGLELGEWSMEKSPTISKRHSQIRHFYHQVFLDAKTKEPLAGASIEIYQTVSTPTVKQITDEKGAKVNQYTVSVKTEIVYPTIY
jgi:hypothetical protein